MGNGNSRVRERFELALDGRQIAVIVVVALGTVGAAFALGVRTGGHVAAKQAAVRPASLDALDRPLTASDVPAPAVQLEYATALPKVKQVPPPPLEQPAPKPAPKPAAVAVAAAAAPPTPTTPPSPAEVVVPAPPPAPTVTASAVAPARPTQVGTPAGTAGKNYIVQLASERTRDAADKVAARVKVHAPRVEEADVPGKGHFFRVRVGRFDSKERAERFLADLGREAGVRGVVMPE